MITLDNFTLNNDLYNIHIMTFQIIFYTIIHFNIFILDIFANISFVKKYLNIIIIILIINNIQYAFTIHNEHIKTYNLNNHIGNNEIFIEIYNIININIDLKGINNKITYKNNITTYST